MVYNYGTKGNQLQSVSGGYNYNKTYSYNSNGSMIADGTLSFQYNELNLPKQVTGTPVGAVSYTYDAAGIKFTKQTVSETRQYIDGIEYNGATIALLHTTNGVARNNAGTYTYEFFLKDHLGNTRIVHNSTGTLLQQTDYYAFGMDIARSQSVPDKYKYNGKEKQDELGQYDYGARFYDPVVGRWHVVDPLADKWNQYSTYSYTINNPINFIDPDGMDVDDWVRREDGSIYWDKNANSQATTKAGETYLGKTLTFNFNSYIDAKSWDGPNSKAPGNKLTTTVHVTGNENEKGELTSVSAGKHVEIGPTPVGTGRDFYPGLGKDQNKFSLTSGADGVNLNVEQHGSVSGIEEMALNIMGYDVVNVAQKLNVNISPKGEVGISAATDIFPSATLTVNGTSVMQYNQPSFKATHTRGQPTFTDNGMGGVFAEWKYKQAQWYKRR